MQGAVPADAPSYPSYVAIAATGIHTIASAHQDIYETLDEVGRLMWFVDRMNINNMSPILGVAEAKDLGFREWFEHATVSHLIPPPSPPHMFSKCV